MATWEVEITVVDVDDKRIAVKGTRTDGEDVRTYSARGKIEADNIQASLRSMMDVLFAAHTAAITAEAANAALIDGWEAAAATYLDGLET